ncbi:MAG: hypothetical protein ACT4PX_05150 [Actinomycetota bacterium]
MKTVRYAVLMGAVAASGVYLFVYLFRWEWHRALVAGVLFVGAEIALASAAILDRLRAIESRLQAGAPAGAGAAPAAGGPEALERLREAQPEPRTNFDWLTRQSGEMSVFVPLLLGAGVVLSGMAWIVERLARATAGPVLERGLSVRLAPLSMPAGVFAGAPAPVARRRSIVPHVVAGVLAVGLATAGLDALADASQNRPDAKVAGTASSVVLHVDPGSVRGPLVATRALWGACTTQIGDYRLLGVTDLGGDLVQLVVEPRVGKYAERRLRGCFGDAVINRIQASVRSVVPLAVTAGR